MAVTEIGARIKLDGEQEYREQMRQITQQTKLMQNETKNMESQWGKGTSAMQKATDQANLLNRQIEQQEKTIKTINDNIAVYSQKTGENSAETLKWKNELEKAEIELARMKSELEKIPQPLEIIGQKMEKTGQKIKAAGEKISAVGSVLTRTITTPVLAAAAAAIKLGSDYEENVNKVDVAFGDSADAVKTWAKTATQNFGMSESAALEASSAFGDMATSMGLSDDEAAEMSIQLAGLAGDLASFKNIDIKTAMTALKGVFTGETESLKGLGVVMTETNLKQFAEDMGLVYGEMSQAEKVTLRYQYVMEKTANAQGDYLRTSDGFANSFRTLKAEVSNLGASFGQELLPYVTPLVQKITEIVKGFGNLDESTKQMIIRIGGLAAAIGPVLYVGGKLVSGIGTFLIKAGGVVSWIGSVLPGLSGILGVLGPMAVGFGLAAGAGAALGFALKGLVDKYGESSKLGDFNQQILETAEAARQARKRVADTTTELEKTTKNAEQIMKEAETSAELTDRYAEELYDLAGKTELTVDEQRRLEAIVSALNQMYPGFTAAVLDSNGSLKMGTEELKAYIGQLKESARVEALKQVIEEYTEKIIEAEKAQIEAEHALKDAQEAANAVTNERSSVMDAYQAELTRVERAQENLNRVQNEGEQYAGELADAQSELEAATGELYDGVVEVDGEIVEFNGSIEDLSDSQIGLTDETQRLNKEVEKQEKAVEEASEKQSEYQGELDKSAENLENMVGSILDGTEATEENTEAVEDSSEAYGQYADDVDDAAEEIKKAQEEIRKAYDDAKKSARDSVMNQTSLFEELEKQEEVTVEKMRQGLQSHIQAMSDWNRNMSKLTGSTRYQVDANFRGVVDTIAQAGLDAAPELAAITKAFENGDQELELLVRDYGRASYLSEGLSESIAGATVSAKYGLEEVKKAFASAFEDAQIKPAEILKNPRVIIDGAKKGAAVLTSKVYSSFFGAGEQVGTGVGQGATSSTGAVQEGTDAVENTAEAGVEKVENLKKDAQTAGTEIGEAIAKGARATRGEIDSAFTSLRTAVSTNITYIQNQKTSARTAGMQLVTNLNDGINSALSYVTTAMNGVKKVVETGISGIQGLKSTAYAAGNTIGQNIADGLGSTEGANTLKARAVVQAARQSMYDAAAEANAYGWGNHMGGQFASGIGSTEGANTLAGRRVANAARTEFSNADNADLYAWGNHMGHNFADGIAASEGAAVLAARKVANAVANILRHTTPKEGPLKDDDVWGLHMGQNFARGMVESVPEVEYASMMIADAAAIPSVAMVDIDAMSGRNVAERLTSADIMSAFMTAAENIDWRVVIGNREFGRILREQGAFA